MEPPNSLTMERNTSSIVLVILRNLDPREIACVYFSKTKSTESILGHAPTPSYPFLSTPCQGIRGP